MFQLAAFADEISPKLDEQISVCKQNGVSHFELRGVDGKNVLDFDKPLRAEIKSKLKANGMGVACIGSPIGKVKINEPWEPHFERFKIAVEIAEELGAGMIRIFSYYPPSESEDIHQYRNEIIRRMNAKVDYVSSRNIVLVHENERHIYGEKGVDCLDLMKSVESPNFRSAFDFGNFANIGEHPLDNWKFLKPYSAHIHVKDAIGDKMVPAGQGAGQIEPILIDLNKSGYSGFLSLEPHLSRGGQFSGFSGPDLFKTAADALKAILRKNQLPFVGA